VVHSESMLLALLKLGGTQSRLSCGGQNTKKKLQKEIVG